MKLPPVPAVCAVLGMFCHSLRGDTFSDDFNRDDTNWNQAGGPMTIGKDYLITRGKFRIGDKKLQADASSRQEKEMVAGSVETQHGAGHNFTASVDFLAAHPDQNGGAGLAFNYKDAAHYYVVRFRGGGNDQLQFGFKNGPGVGSFVTLATDIHIEPGQWYRLTVASSESKTIHYVLRRIGDRPADVTSGTYLIREAELRGGNAALHAAGEGDYQFDNIAITAK